jgi:ParB/RepB/Spo0J family partition protein
MSCPSSLTEIELAFLDLRYAHTRVASPAAVRALVDSIGRFGQMSPVVVAPDNPRQQGSPPSYVLLDGYRRVEALRRLGRDTVLAELWQVEELDGLVGLLVRSRDRCFEVIEEAQLLRELKARFGLSTEELALRLARDPSWVSRRLALLDSLPPEALSALTAGTLSPWAAGRVLAPLARANPEHARCLVGSLACEPLPTRDLALWWSHYPKANHARRDDMVRHPGAFVRAFRAKAQAASDARLAEGPEGECLRDLRTLTACLRRLLAHAPTVLAPEVPQEIRSKILAALSTAQALFRRLGPSFSEVSHESLPRNPRSHPRPFPEGHLVPADGPPARCHPKDHPASLVPGPISPLAGPR